MYRLSLIGSVLAGCLAFGADGDALRYPQTRQVDHVDVYHGTKVADAYRWLEDDVRKSKEVAEWVAAENAITNAYLETIPQREAVRRRLRDLWNFERYTSPRKVGGHYFYTKNDGLQNQSVLYVIDSLEGTPRVLIDPNQWSKDGTVALAGESISDDGKYLAYGVAEAGSDWRTWHVLDVASGKVLPDEIHWTKYRGTAWTRDGKGFFYGRYDEPKPGSEYQRTTTNQKIFYHRVGTPQSEDVLVYRRPDHPEWDFSPTVTDDGRYLIFTISKGTAAKYRIAYKDLTEPYGMPIDLIEDFDNKYAFIGNDGPIFYFETDLAAPRGRLIAIDLRNPDRKAWKEIMPQATEVLGNISLVGNLFVATYLKDARTQVKMFRVDGSFVRDVEFPGIGSAGGFFGRRQDTETFYTFQSFATPPSIYRYDLITGKSSVFRQPQVKFDPNQYEVEQVFYQSKDGTRVPMFVAHKKGMQRNGANPTLLYGYGGFSIPSTPRFSVAWLSWLEMGGVLAVANLRGGNEYGEEWHLAGTRQRKQNVFDDFIAAAEWLIANQVTRSDRLAIEGRSNGGLLVGAVMTQRPDLFGACLPGVGVMDMLRFNQFTAGRYWVDDYGSPQNPDEFKALYAYSPYHNIKDGMKYPATLVTTADTDDRVVPGHSFKFTAALQRAQAGPAPVLIRIETRAGHGGGKPVSKQVDETADEWAFLIKNLKMDISSGMLGD